MNPFLSPPSPLDAQEAEAPNPMEAAFRQAAQQHAEDEAVRQQLSDLLRKQVQFQQEKMANIGVKGAGMALKEPVKNFLADSTTTLSSSSATALNPAPYVQPAVQSAATVAGGIGSDLASQAVTTTASAAPTALQLGGAALGAAGLGYGAYEGIKGALRTRSQIQEAIKSGAFDDNEIEDMREKLVKTGQMEARTGAASGAIAGGTAGSVVPGIGTAIGAVGGAIVGSAGGELKTIQAQRDMKGNPYVNYLKAKFRKPF
jgi:hypothetical protein